MKLSHVIFAVLMCAAVKCSGFPKTKIPRSAILLPQFVALHDPDFQWSDVDPTIFWNETDKPVMQDIAKSPDAITNIVAAIITEENNRYTNEDQIIKWKNKKQNIKSPEAINSLIAEIILNNGYKVHQKENNGVAKDKTIFDCKETTKLVSPIKDLSSDASTLKANVKTNGSGHHHIIPQFVLRYRPENVGLHAQEQTPVVSDVAPTAYPLISKTHFQPENKATLQHLAGPKQPNRLPPKHKSFYELSYSVNKILGGDMSTKSKSED